MNTHYTYFLILGLSVAGPLALSFDKKVAFYKKWKFVFIAMILPAVFYLVWDIYFTSIGIWQFNAKYVIGLKCFGLPIEEWLFFFIIPYCSVFIYECICCYFPRLTQNKISDVLIQLLAVVLIVAAVFFRQKMYTTVTFVLCGLFIMCIYLFKKIINRFLSSAFIVSFLIVLVPFLIVNGFLTALPVLMYNNAENLGIRIRTIPIEDVFYGLLLILMNVVIYEKLQASRK